MLLHLFSLFSLQEMARLLRVSNASSMECTPPCQTPRWTNCRHTVRTPIPFPVLGPSRVTFAALCYSGVPSSKKRCASTPSPTRTSTSTRGATLHMCTPTVLLIVRTQPSIADSYAPTTRFSSSEGESYCFDFERELMGVRVPPRHIFPRATSAALARIIILLCMRPPLPLAWLLSGRGLPVRLRQVRLLLLLHFQECQHLQDAQDVVRWRCAPFSPPNATLTLSDLNARDPSRRPHPPSPTQHSASELTGDCVRRIVQRIRICASSRALRSPPRPRSRGASRFAATSSPAAPRRRGPPWRRSPVRP